MYLIFDVEEGCDLCSFHILLKLMNHPFSHLYIPLTNFQTERDLLEQHNGLHLKVRFCFPEFLGVLYVLLVLTECIFN